MTLPWRWRSGSLCSPQGLAREATPDAPTTYRKPSQRPQDEIQLSEPPHHALRSPLTPRSRVATSTYHRSSSSYIVMHDLVTYNPKLHMIITRRPHTPHQYLEPPLLKVNRPHWDASTVTILLHSPNKIIAFSISSCHPTQ
jgi:hypothetical protein